MNVDSERKSEVFKMQSEEKNVWGSPTSVLFIPKLPPSLSNWKALKTHFSLYGDVTNVLINPQQRCCTVSFKTVADAEYAISNGCVWKNKKFDAFFCSNRCDSLRLDPRATVSQELGYSELDVIWSDEDNENFGVVESKPVMNEIKPNVKSQSASKEKNENEKSIESQKPRLKLYSEKISNLKSTSKDHKKETKKTTKESLASKKKSASTSKKKLKASSLDPNSKQELLNLKKKFVILEERDKYIRKKYVKNSNVKLAKTVIGTCPDMCPEKERIMRESRRLVSIYEMIPGTQEMDHSLAVKAYVRSSADQEEPLPHELRPEPVLSMTMSYLISKIMPLIEDPDVNVSDWYDFCWDRLRSIRKDIIQQQLCDLETVTIIEQCARFHICCYDRLWGADPLVFDEKINTENLMNCLQSLRHMYEDLAKVNVKCPNEAEFIAYMILLNMKTGDLMACYQQFPEHLLQEENVQSAVKVYLMFNNAMYSQFFKLVKRSTYLNSCLLQRYFYHIRVQALQAIARAYCPPSKGSTVPLKHMTEILKFDSSKDTAAFCEGHGLSLKDTKIRLVRNDFFIPETKIKLYNSSSLITEKRLPLIKAVVGDGKCNLRSFKDHKVHSSFTPDGRLNEMALDASDQKSKLSEMVIKTSDNLKEEKFGVDVTDMKQPVEEEELAFDQHDGIYQQEESLPMEVDAEILPNYSDNFSLIQNEAINDSTSDLANNDAPPRKQRSTMSSFKFDLKAINKPEIKNDSMEPPQSSFQSYFGSSANSSLALGNTNLFSEESKQNQFNLINIFHPENSKETSQHSSMIHVDVFGSDISTKLQSKIINESYVKKKHLNRIPSVGHDKSKPFTDSSSDRNASHSFLLSFPKKEEIKPSEDEDLSREEKSIDGSKKESELSSANHDFNENLGKFDSDLLKDYDYHDQPSNVNRKKQKIIEENKIEGVNIITEKIKRNENKLTVESNKQAIRNLKVNLKRRLKAATVRQYIRKWRQKVKKIKQFRKEFPILFSVPAEQHAHVWGTTANINTFSTRSLLNRLKDKQHSISIVNTILDKGLKNIVPYLGHEIAENIAVSNLHSGLRLRDFNVPLCWKLIVSVPFEKENDFFIKKFNTLFRKLFYKLEHSLLGSVTEEITSQSIPFYYCVHLVSGIDLQGQKDKITGMSGLIFIVINGFENSSDKCKRFKNLLSCDKSMKQVPVSLMKIGKNDDEQQLIKLLNEKMKKRKIKKWMEEYWADFKSLLHVLKFLTAGVDLSSKLRVSTLSSLLKEISEHIFNGLVAAKTISNDFSIALRNPNHVIMFYTMFITFLEKIILKSNCKDFNVIPPEFKEYVKYLNKPGELSPVRVDFSKARRPNVVKAFSKIKLAKIEPWPPHDEDDLLNTLSSYCKLVECSHVLPRVMRMIDLKDDVEFLKYLNDVSWIDVIDLLMRYSLESNFIDNQRLVVICNDYEISDLCQIEFSFKLLQFVKSQNF